MTLSKVFAQDWDMFSKKRLFVEFESAAQHCR